MAVDYLCDEHVFDYDGGMAMRGLGLAERRSVVAAAREALVGLGEVLGQASDGELAAS